MHYLTPDLQFFHEWANYTEPIRSWGYEKSPPPTPEKMEYLRSRIHEDYYKQALEMARRIGMQS